MDTSLLFKSLEYLGILAGSVDGALYSIRNKRTKFDITGVVGLAMASALGGGMTRDVLLGRGVPLALENPLYLGTAISGALLSVMFHKSLGQSVTKTILLVDAAALALFAVSGSTRALDAELSLLPAILLGVVTAAGGGAWRDVLSGCPPKVFVRGQLYVIVALAACTLFVLASAAGVSRAVASPLAIGFGFLFRLLTLRFNWQTQAIVE